MLRLPIQLWSTSNLKINYFVARSIYLYRTFTTYDESQNDTDVPEFKSKFLQILFNRGFLNQCTDYSGLDDKLSSNSPVAAYIGFDATASSLHVGSLVQIMMLRHFQNSGHQPIVVLGGATTKIGDPSGKDESRKLLDDKSIQANLEGISNIFRRVLRVDSDKTNSSNTAIIVDNSQWLGNLTLIDTLRIYGRHISVNRMLSMASVKTRLDREQPLSFLEFNYMILQAIDFTHLSKYFGCVLQMGGSDQWGNIVTGIELAKKISDVQLYGLTAPLITNSDGKKMGKTESGAIWLDKELLSSYDFWQFWRNTSDADTIRYLKLFTEIPLEQINEFSKLSGAELNQVKILLADEVTKMLHGEECLSSIRQTVQATFGGSSNSLGDDLPVLKVTPEEFTSKVDGLYITELFVRSGLTPSKGEAKRLIQGHGLKLNDHPISDEKLKIGIENFQSSPFSTDKCKRIKISNGKKKHAIIELIN